MNDLNINQAIRDELRTVFLSDPKGKSVLAFLLNRWGYFDRFLPDVGAVERRNMAADLLHMLGVTETVQQIEDMVDAARQPAPIDEGDDDTIIKFPAGDDQPGAM